MNAFVLRGVLNRESWSSLMKSELMAIASCDTDTAARKSAIKRYYAWIALALSWLRQRHQHIHVADREQPSLATQGALVPIDIHLLGEDDDVALTEVQLALLIGVEGVHRPATGLIQDQRTDRWKGRESISNKGRLTYRARPKNTEIQVNKAWKED